MKVTINQTTFNNVTNANERSGETGTYLTVTLTDNVSVKDLEELLENVETMTLEKADSAGKKVVEDLSNYKTFVSINKQISDNAEDLITYQMRG